MQLAVRALFRRSPLPYTVLDSRTGYSGTVYRVYHTTVWLWTGHAAWHCAAFRLDDSLVGPRIYHGRSLARLPYDAAIRLRCRALRPQCAFGLPMRDYTATALYWDCNVQLTPDTARHCDGGSPVGNTCRHTVVPTSVSPAGRTGPVLPTLSGYRLDYHRTLAPPQLV